MNGRVIFRKKKFKFLAYPEQTFLELTPANEKVDVVPSVYKLTVGDLFSG